MIVHRHRWQIRAAVLMLDAAAARLSAAVVAVAAVVPMTLQTQCGLCRLAVATPPHACAWSESCAVCVCVCCPRVNDGGCT